MKPLNLLPVLVVLSSTPVVASTFDDHLHLYHTLQRVGVNVSINAPDCHKRQGVDGYYQSHTRHLVICQDKMNRSHQEVDWTNNDYDTLRHESWHVAQDCNGNGIGNGYLKPVMDLKYSYAVLGRQQAQSLMSNPVYRSQPQVHHVEMEAFAVASRESARSIADKLLQCYSL